MALSPLNLGRVSFPQQTSTLLDSLRRNSLAMLAQVNTGPQAILSLFR